MAQVTELVTKFSFEGGSGPLNEYNASLGKGIGLLAGMTAALGATGVAVAKWTTSVLQAFDATEQLSRSTGESVEWIQEMGFVASVNGGSVQGFQSTVESLSQKIGEAAQKGSEDFARLGISVRGANGQVKSAEQVLDEVAQRFDTLNLSMSEQRSFAEALGIDPSMLQTLNLGADRIGELRAEAQALGVLTAEQADQAIAYNDSLTKLRFGFDGLQRMIAVGIAPQLTELAEGFSDLLAENKDWIIEGVQATMNFIGEFIKMLGRLAPVLGGIAAAFVVAKVATIGWTAALAALFSPAVLIAAGIAGILLVVDDLIVAFQGGNSVIADFFESFFGWDIQPILQGIADTIAGIIQTIKDLIALDFGKIWEDFKANMPDISGIASFFGFGDNEMQPGTDPSFQPGAGMGGNTDQSSRVDQTVNMEIRTSDPERAGRSAADNLQRQLDDAQTLAKRGGR